MTTPEQNPTTILIIDVATSGFRPDTDTILEVAVVLVDAATLDVLDVHSSVVRHTEDIKVPEFHKALLQECCNPLTANSMLAVEGFLLAGQWSLADVVCNRALDFDMKFLAKHMKLLHAALTKNKPQIELKALERIHIARGGKPYESTVPRTFRAPDDAVRAYEELVHYVGGGIGGGAQ